MEPIFFKNTQKLREWLQQNHKTASVLWLGYYKVKSPKFNFTWSESVDELLCFGWIDGLRKSIDSERYMIRITPRKPNSNWSKINIDKVKILIEKGLMKKAGLQAFENRKSANSNNYSFEQRNVSLLTPYKNVFKSNKKAWNFFNNLSPTTKKQSIWWVMSAKKEVTQLRRLHILINCSENEEKINPLRN